MYRAAILIAVLTGGLLCLNGGTEAFGQDDSEPLRAVGMLNVTETSPSVLRAARSAVTGPDGATKDGPLASVGMELAVLYHQHRTAGSAGVQAIRDASSGPRMKAADDDRRRDAGRIPSPISADGRFVTVDAIASDGASGLLGDLRQLGLQGGARAGRVVSGRLPISAVKDAASLAALQGMMPSHARMHAGAVESEADSSHRAGEARANFGVGGNGQKVCVMSSSYDQDESALTSAADDIASGDLPSADRIDVLEEFDTETSNLPKNDEGRAMLQLIHDIAPGARLGFHTAAGGIANFANGISELASAGCTVIVDDIGISAEPFYQDGPITNAIDDVVNNDGVAYFSSAGNDGQNSYEAPFRDSEEPGVINSSSDPHDFDSALANTDVRQEVTIEAGGTLQVTFQWTDPSALVDGSEGPDTDLDVALVTSSDSVVAEGSNDNISNGVPVEFIEYTNDSGSSETLFLAIEKAAGPDPDEIKYVYRGNDFTIEEYDVSNATIFGHQMAEGAMAVAAAPFFSTAAYRSDIDSSAFLESFSSKGGLQIRFDQNGDPVDPPEPREKPDVTGTDWIDNTFFGQDIDDSAIGGIDPDPHPNFPGTSAAAPNIAAIAALIRQAAPDLTPVQVYDRLENTAVDVQVRRKIVDGELVLVPIAAGVDPWSGHGFVRADRAVPAPAGVQITDASASASPNNRRAIELAWKNVGEERGSVDEFLLERQFFTGAFAEQARIDAGGGTEFARTVEDLPVGEHTFRISALRNDSTLAVARTSAVVREDEVSVSVYPNPFQETVNLSVTFPETRSERQFVRVDVFDVLGRRVATPILSREIGDSESLVFNSQLPSSLADGVYFFQVWNEDFEATTKAVRAR